MKPSLLDRTFDLLSRSTLRRAEIAKRAKVGSEWLKKLEAGDIKDPSVRRIQRLHDFLDSDPVPQVERETPMPGRRRAAAGVQT